MGDRAELALLMADSQPLFFFFSFLGGRRAPLDEEAMGIGIDRWPDWGSGESDPTLGWK